MSEWTRSDFHSFTLAATKGQPFLPKRGPSMGARASRPQRPECGRDARAPTASDSSAMGNKLKRWRVSFQHSVVQEKAAIRLLGMRDVVRDEDERRGGLAT